MSGTSGRSQITRKAPSRLEVRALKWPFTSNEVEEIVDDLEKYEQTFSLALQVDYMSVLCVCYHRGEKND